MTPNLTNPVVKQPLWTIGCNLFMSMLLCCLSAIVIFPLKCHRLKSDSNYTGWDNGQVATHSLYLPNYHLCSF